MCRSFSPSESSTTAPVPARSDGESSSASGGDGESSKRLAQHLSLLLGVVRSRRWHAFASIALANPSVYRLLSSTVPQHEEFGGRSLLHAVLQCDPPAELVAKMVGLAPDRRAALRCRDRSGRTPLHAAAAGEANPLIVKMLAGADPAACLAVDEDGRTPLHLASCGDASSSPDAPGDASAAPSSHEPQGQPSRALGAVRALLSESLEATLIEDADGTSPLEGAIVGDASFEIVNLLQKATMEALRRREASPGKNKRRRPTSDDAAAPAVRTAQRRRGAILG
ncbi:hypothetical protein ACHAXT_012274 [Thalassiosira profunda]